MLKRVCILVSLFTVLFINSYADEALTIDASGRILVQMNGQQVELITYLNPTGTIQAYSGQITGSGMQEPSPGWFYCNGAYVSRQDYNALFLVIGYSFNPKDENDNPVITDPTVFYLPDLRGIFARGAGSNGSMTKKNGSAYAGGNVGDQYKDQFQNHVHHYTDQHVSAFIKVDTKNDNTVSDQNYVIEGKNTSPVNTNNYNTGDDETRPASVSVNYLIKY